VADIFLSYNREDSLVARRFAEGLEREGFSVWWDTALRSGEAYDEVTEAALRDSGAVVVLWSPRSVVSRWVRAEATLAERAAKLIPAMIEPCQRPIMFELTQTAELGHWQGDTADAAWRGFVSDLERHLGNERTPGTAAPAAPAPAAEPLLAVLPFDNLSPDPEMDFFSDGVSEEIIGLLTKGARLKVIGRTSSFQYRGADKPRALGE
jgi:TIR domain